MNSINLDLVESFNTRLDLADSLNEIIFITDEAQDAGLIGYLNLEALPVAEGAEPEIDHAYAWDEGFVLMGDGASASVFCESRRSWTDGKSSFYVTKR